MTVKEKRDELERFCRCTECSTCVLHDVSFRPHGLCYAPSLPDNIVIENYKLVFGSDKTDNDPVNSPAHYTDGKIEVIDFIEDKKLGFCLGNAVKYIARAGKKDPTKEIEDLNKARWYIDRRIKELQEA